MAAQLYASRRQRDRVFVSVDGGFGEPAWDMLLILYIMDAGGRQATIRELLAARGWEQRAAVGGVFGNWPRIVGPELARHTKPERFDDGELTIVADSNAWAQQVRLLSAQLVRRLNEELGHGTVRRVKVLGPASGPRRPGAWRVR